VRWRGRVIAVSEDDQHILYGSGYGEPGDWQTGGEVVDATQAFAGTTAAAGAIPDPVTALMPANDDLMFVGTNRSLWRLTGDPHTGASSTTSWRRRASWARSRARRSPSP